MPIFTNEQLIHIATDIFVGAGTSRKNARIVAELLADANCTGHDSHGIIRIPQYLGSVEKGHLVTNAEVEIIQDNPLTAIVDGNWGFGQVAMTHAVEIGLEKARSNGLSAVAVRHTNHIGRLGSYVHHLACEGMIGLLFVNAVGIPSFRMAPWGGTEPRLSTDPIAFGIPRSSGEPIVMDMTSTVVAEGKVRVKRNRNETTPDGWLLDSMGRPTNDPNKLYEDPPGSILPLGGTSAGHKGYGLNIVIELLAGILSGTGAVGSNVDQISNGVLLVTLDITQFLSLEDYYRQADKFIEHVKSSPPAEGFEEILFPGDIEIKVKGKRQGEGIFVEEDTWNEILEWGGKFNVDVRASGAL